MKKVAKLVSFTLTTRVIVDEDASDDQIIKACYPKIIDKIDNRELGDNLESIEYDEECPFGTFETDSPTIDRVILNVGERLYLVIGKGIPVQIIKFDDFSDWDSVQNLDGTPVFDIQIDNDPDCDEPYQFQYVNLIWREDEDNWEVGMDYQGVKVEVTTTPIAQIVVDLLTNK